MEKKKISIQGVTWFLTGILLGLFFLLSFLYILFEQAYRGKIYPGVRIGDQSFAGQTKGEVLSYFNQKNRELENTQFSFKYEDLVATVSAKTLEYGYNSELLAVQAVSLGRSDDPFSNLSLKTQAYFQRVELVPSYRFSEKVLEEVLAPITTKVDIEPVDALFSFQPTGGGKGRVVVFRPSSDGQEVDLETLKRELTTKFSQLVGSGGEKTVTIPLKILIKKAKIQTSQANNFGIKELLGSGSSRFAGSISNRIYNIQLAASHLNGLLVAPGETFSFNQVLGDVSKFTGYKEAFIIQGGKTILGDGGGVCQVSTTFFRAILNSGLPIVERHAHSYRVGYYEQDMKPGFDATVYAPSVDLKFKNDTQNYILIQAYTNILDNSLTFALYGTSDNRKAIISQSQISNQRPPPAPEYIDDPNLPRGVERQIDFAAWGANAAFTRVVERDGQVLFSEKFTSNYQPWKAVYLRGTRE